MICRFSTGTEFWWGIEWLPVCNSCSTGGYKLAALARCPGLAASASTQFSLLLSAVFFVKSTKAFLSFSYVFSSHQPLVSCEGKHITSLTGQLETAMVSIKSSPLLSKLSPCHHCYGWSSAVPPLSGHTADKTTVSVVAVGQQWKCMPCCLCQNQHLTSLQPVWCCPPPLDACSSSLEGVPQCYITEAFFTHKVPTKGQNLHCTMAWELACVSLGSTGNTTC